MPGPAKPKPGSTSMRNIRRMDDDSRGTHAWLVQVQRHHQVTTRMFSDSVWGGKRKALAAAREWRDEHNETRAAYVHELWRRNVRRRSNRSGMVGVARYERKPKAGAKSGTGYVYWMASWIDEHGASRKRKFSVGKWGERRAKQMAIETREREVRKAVAARTG